MKKKKETDVEKEENKKYYMDALNAFSLINLVNSLKFKTPCFKDATLRSAFIFWWLIVFACFFLNLQFKKWLNENCTNCTNEKFEIIEMINGTQKEKWVASIRLRIIWKSCLYIYW